MALSANNILQVQYGGSDTNGGGFRPTNSNMDATLSATSANTSAPIVSTSNYNFQSTDVGAWIFIKSGTNWIPGLYQIASVVSNKATLSAAIGSAFLFNTSSWVPYTANTVAGCASVASPTAGTWTMDYTQQNSPNVSVTDAVTAATTTITSATASFGKNHVGSLIYISGGTGAISLSLPYEIISVTNSTTITVDRSTGLTTGIGATLNIGGALASLGGAGQYINGIFGPCIFQQYNANNYLMNTPVTPLAVASGTVTLSAGTVSAVNVTFGGSGYQNLPGGVGTFIAVYFTGDSGTGATGLVQVTAGVVDNNVVIDHGGSGYTNPTARFQQGGFNVPGGGIIMQPGANDLYPSHLVGYAANRHINNLDVNRPYNIAGVGGLNMVSPSNGQRGIDVINIICDSNCPTYTWNTSFAGSATAAGDYRIINCKALNFQNRGFGAGANCIACEAVNGVSHSFFEACAGFYCVARNLVGPAAAGQAGYDGLTAGCYCLAINTGFGFSMNNDGLPLIGQVAYGCTFPVGNAIGFYTASTGRGCILVDCISYGNYQNYNLGTPVMMINCATGYPSDGATAADSIQPIHPNTINPLIVLTHNPFVNPQTSIPGDFSLNNIAGGGALLKGAGFAGNLGAWLASQVSYGTGHADVGALQHLVSLTNFRGRRGT